MTDAAFFERVHWNEKEGLTSTTRISASVSRLGTLLSLFCWDKAPVPAKEPIHSEKEKARKMKTSPQWSVNTVAEKQGLGADGDAWGAELMCYRGFFWVWIMLRTPAYKGELLLSITQKGCAATCATACCDLRWDRFMSVAVGETREETQKNSFLQWVTQLQ